jgi:hypothetical protein
LPVVVRQTTPTGSSRPPQQRAAVDGELSTFRTITGRGLSRLVQQFAAKRELVGTPAVGKEAVMADAMEPICSTGFR